MKSKLPWIFLLLALAAGGAALQWQRHKPAATSPGTVDPASGSATTPATATSATSKAVPVMALAASDLALLQTIPLVQMLPVSGPVKAVQSAFVKARVSGELQDLLVREGDYVKAGQVIARVDSTEYQARLRQAQQQAQSAKAQVDIAQRTFDNNRSLVEQGFISKTALEISASNLAASQASYQAAQSGVEVLQKSVDDAVLRAPITGQISQRLAQNGERVAIDGRVVEIVDLAQLEMEASLSAEDAAKVRLGQVAQVSLDGSTDTVAAKVVRVNPNATAGSRAVVVYLALAPHAQLRQGLFLQGRLSTGSRTGPALPLSAVRTDKPVTYVQIVVDGKVEHQPVVTGFIGDYQGQTMVEVIGLAAGTRALLGSIGSVLAGTPVTINEAGN
jgi:RND family efflux transporter MFP subunit